MCTAALAAFSRPSQIESSGALVPALTPPGIKPRRGDAPTQRRRPILSRGSGGERTETPSSANDPTLLARPTSRPGKALYAKNLEAKKKAGLEALDVVSLFRIAEVWVRVRHQLIPSLTYFVNETEPRVRSYVRQDIDEAGAEFRNRYDVWRKELRRFDKALMAETYI